MPDITQILDAVETGDAQAAAQLLPLVYDELRRLAAAKLSREAPGQTLDATGLVHEAYLKLAAAAGTAGEPGGKKFNDLAHFYAVAAEAMRCILIDNARKKRSDKRGGGLARVDRLEDVAAPTESAVDLLAIDEALAKLTKEDPETGRLINLRYYAGLSLEETARVMGLSRATAYRTWNYGKAWMRTLLESIDPKTAE
jgi:RNA polymerase sigma factor (TIGR02999 family)